MKENMLNCLKNDINNTQIEIIKTNERMNNMNVHILNAVSGAIMSPVIDRLCKKIKVEEVQNLYDTLETMCEEDLIEEAFCVLHTIIKSSGVRVPKEYQCIVDNPKLRAEFAEEAIADIEDILYDLE